MNAGSVIKHLSIDWTPPRRGCIRKTFRPHSSLESNLFLYGKLQKLNWLVARVYGCGLFTFYLPPARQRSRSSPGSRRALKLNMYDRRSIQKRIHSTLTGLISRRGRQPITRAGDHNMRPALNTQMWHWCAATFPRGRVCARAKLLSFRKRRIDRPTAL